MSKHHWIRIYNPYGIVCNIKTSFGFNKCTYTWLQVQRHTDKRHFWIMFCRSWVLGKRQEQMKFLWEISILERQRMRNKRGREMKWLLERTSIYYCSAIWTKVHTTPSSISRDSSLLDSGCRVEWINTFGKDVYILKTSSFGSPTTSFKRSFEQWN